MRVDLVFKPDRHMVLDYVLRVRDASRRHQRHGPGRARRQLNADRSAAVTCPERARRSTMARDDAGARHALVALCALAGRRRSRVPPRPASSPRAAWARSRSCRPPRATPRSVPRCRSASGATCSRSCRSASTSRRPATRRPCRRRRKGSGSSSTAAAPTRASAAASIAIALFVEGGVGASMMSSNVLEKVKILDPGEHFSITFHGRRRRRVPARESALRCRSRGRCVPRAAVRDHPGARYRACTFATRTAAASAVGSRRARARRRQSARRVAATA